MKKVLLVIIVFAFNVTMTFAQQKQTSVAISFPQNIVEYFAQPASAKAPLLPLIQAKSKSGELFGVNFQGVDGNSSFIELLDSTGKAVKAVTVNEFLGKSSTKGVKLVSSTIAGSGNRSENVYEITTTQGKFSLIASSLATAVRSTKETPAKLFVRMILKDAPGTIYSAHIILPVEGTAEIKSGGFIISGKKSTQPMVSTVYPKADKVLIEKKNVSITTKSIKVGNESLLLFLTIDCANTKDEGTAALLSYDQKNEINISIVNVSNKTTARPGDTISYQIICTNIGSGSASDIVITNPIAAGAQYLDNSAEGVDTEISFDRNAAATPALGEAKMIKWKLTKNLNVGEEKVVSFKVLIK